MIITTAQAIDLAAALVHAEAAMRIFEANPDELPKQLVFARYNAERALEHIAASINGLPQEDMAAVDDCADRLRRAPETRKEDA